MDVLTIHNFPQYADQCCDLINQEWPRSKTARMRSLEMSCDSLPSSLILVNSGRVIGHSKVSQIPSIPTGCFIESVVIHPEYRGRGLGKFLMSKTEEYIQSRGMETVYLSTIDKQEFYSKLGYSECEKISLYGGWVNSTSLANYRQPLHFLPKVVPSSKSKAILDNSTPSLLQKTDILDKIKTPPPPPPPPFPSLGPQSFTSDTKKTLFKTYMKKDFVQKNTKERTN